MTVRIFCLGLLLSLSFISSCAVNPVSGKRDFVLMSEEKEIQLGREANPQIVKENGGRYDDPELQAYVQGIGEKLAAHSDRTNLVYRFTVLDTPLVNAFALPGGYIYITRGILAYMNSEAEMAGVLGHEIGHVNARHSVRQISKAQGAGYLYTIGSIFLPQLRTQGIQDLFNILGSAWISGYGRKHELEADHLGAVYLARSGYDPRAMIKVIGILKNQEGFEKQLAKEEGREPRIYHGVFASHPDNDKRLQEVVSSAEALKGTATTVKVDRESFLKELDGLVYGVSEKQGILRENTFYHKDLGIAIQFPAGWKVENLPDRLVAKPGGGDGVLQVQVEDVNKRISPREFMEQRLKLHKLTDGEELNPHGLKGYTAVAELRTSFGKRKARVSVIYHHAQAFVFTGVAKDKKTPDKYQGEFLAAARSFHVLSGDERRLASSLRIRLVRAQEGDTFESLAKTSVLSHHAVDQLRLLNDLYPKGEPRAGQMIKVVE